jgi:hypothetical protein
MATKRKRPHIQTVQYQDVPRQFDEMLTSVEKEKVSFLVMKDGALYGVFKPYEEA